ncbi:MAG: nucleotidyltransferase domain-containing protein [Betaproteobacteria bacterium]|nr:nucleotidyltransferase domain-containing protein [Betaproteobacteria bacterium]
MRYAELSLAAQTAYAELAEQTRAFELNQALSGQSGSFQKLQRKGRDYWYFAYRDLGDKVRMVYLGPDDDEVRKAIDGVQAKRGGQATAPQAKAALQLGCAPVAPKHFSIIKRLAEYGFFRAGGVLIGTHAFLVLGNLLGVKWASGATTLDVDFAHAGKNVSIALPADLKIDVHDALTSLEMGLLPISQFDGSFGAQYRNPKDQELRLDFVTSMTRDGKAVVMPDLKLALEPLKFMEFSLEGTVQGCVIGTRGSCIVNLPAPERMAVHKLIVYGERPVRERTKANKDLLQAASLASYFHETGGEDVFNAAWRDALGRGKGWKERAREGKAALLRMAPELEIPGLWREK